MADKKTKKGEKSDSKKIFKIVAVIIALVIVFFIANYVFQNLNKFEYRGLTFTIGKELGIKTYDYYYYFQKGGQVLRYDFRLRLDPRTNNVPVSGDKIILPPLKPVFESMNYSSIEQCQYNLVAKASFEMFLVQNGVKINGASPIKDEAVQYNLSYVTCENAPNSPVILIQGANESSIVRNGNCYVINVADCDLLKALEKFRLELVINSKTTSNSITN